MAKFGWCLSGFHADYKGEWSRPCKGSYRLVLFEEQRRGRKTIQVKVKDETRTCDCSCHQDS